jgi:hypothetical protein
MFMARHSLLMDNQRHTPLFIRNCGSTACINPSLTVPRPGRQTAIVS